MLGGKSLSSKGGGAGWPVSLRERLKQLLRRLHTGAEGPAAAAPASTPDTDLQHPYASTAKSADEAAHPDCGWAVAESIAWLAQQARAAEDLPPGSDAVLRLLESPVLHVTAVALEQLADRTACEEHRAGYGRLCTVLDAAATVLGTVAVHCSKRDRRKALALEHRRQADAACAALQPFCEEGRSAELLAALQRLPQKSTPIMAPTEQAATSESQGSGSGGCQWGGRWELLKPRLPVRVFMHGDELVPRIDEALKTTRNVGIFGVPGCGATTIAAAVAERVASRFDAVVWVTIENSPNWTLTRAGLDLFPSTSIPVFPSAHDRVKHISEKLMKEGRSVLLVLDGVRAACKDGASDVEALNFATCPTARSDRSRLIVTGRDRAALTLPQLGASEEGCSDGQALKELHAFDVPCLDAESAIDMLRFHAFGSTDAAPPACAPPGACTQLAKRCKGRPLALRVLGGALRHCTCRVDWEAVLSEEPASKARSTGQVRRACAVSIGLLPPSLQQCLAAIAAQSGINVPQAQVLHACAALAPLYTPAAVRAAGHKLRQLEERGLLCVRQAHTRRIYYLHAAVRGALALLGMQRLPAWRERRDMRATVLAAPLSGTAKTQHLKASIVSVKGWCRSGQAVPQPLTCHVDGQVDHIAWLVVGRALPESVKQRLHDTRGFSAAEVSMLDCFAGSLELDLSGCPHLVQLPESIADERTLHRLDLSGCTHLACLPESLGSCLRLLHLNLSGCERLAHLPAGIGGCAQLAHLDLHSCRSLECLPDTLGGCSMMLGLDLSGCQQLACLPESLGGLTRMTHLSLHKCPRLQEMPAGIGKCAKLQFLDLSYCCSLPQLPAALGACTALRGLALMNCSALHHLPPALAQLSDLRELHLRGCPVSIAQADLPPQLQAAAARARSAVTDRPFIPATAKWNHSLGIQFQNFSFRDLGNTMAESIVKQYNEEYQEEERRNSP